MDATAESATVRDPGRLRVLALLGVGVFVTALDQTVVVTAIPAMVRDLEIPFSELDRAAWIVTAFLIGYAVALPLAGRLADTRVKRNVYLAALALFAVSSIVAALAGNLWLLVGARVVQAAGGGALVPVTLAYAGEAYEGRKRTVAFGLIVAAAEAGSVLGPLWGAAITQALSWRWIFWLNLPLAALIAVGVWQIPPRPPSRRAAFDWTGALLIAVGLALVTIGLARDRSFSPVLAGGLAAAGLAVLGLFVLIERRVLEPLIDVRLFRLRPFAAGIAVSALAGGALIIPMVNVPLYVATVLLGDALQGGLLLLQLTMMIPVGAVVGGLLAARSGNRLPVILGSASAALGLALASGWTAQPDQLALTRDLMLTGFGFGLLIAPLTATVVGAAGERNAGVGAGLVTVSRLVGMMLALAALTPWALDRFNRAAAVIPLPFGQSGASEAELARLSAAFDLEISAATVQMFNELFGVAALLCLVAVLPAALLVGRSGRLRSRS